MYYKFTADDLLINNASIRELIRELIPDVQWIRFEHGWEGDDRVRIAVYLGVPDRYVNDDSLYDSLHTSYPETLWSITRYFPPSWAQFDVWKERGMAEMGSWKSDDR